MEDEWDDSGAVVAIPPPASTNSYNNYGSNDVDEGHSLSKGRGFTSFQNEEDNDFKSNGFGDRRGRGGRGGRGGGRGGRGARGGGGWEARDRDNEENGGDDYNDGDRDRGERGRGRGRGRGGRGRGGFGERGERDADGGEQEPELDENGEPKKPPVTYVPPEPTDNEDELFGSGISSGINFDNFDNIAVKVSGENPPRNIDSFETANFRKYVLDNILKSGYKKPTPIQKHAIPIIMGGRDLMGCAQTGSGKTAAFLLPIINTLLQDTRELVIGPGGCAEPQVVIMSPTRELTLQIFNEARKFAHGSVLKIAVAYGGVAVRHQGDNISRGCHILVATPGRLHDFVDRNRVAFGSIRFIVLDEADRMLDMGFMPSVEKMMEHSTMVPMDQRQTLMFSATFPEDIQNLAMKFLNNYLFVAVGIVGGASADVEQIFHQVTKYEKQTTLKKLIEDNDKKRILVFVETKRNADFIASLLSEQQMLTSSIHGDRMQRERELALQNFKSGAHYILVATAVAARGLDIKNVDIVVNYDLPKSIDEYVHRIGRTGRVGNRGKAVSFFDADQDAALVADLAKILRQADQPIPDFLQGGGTATYRGNKYGGSDVRNFNNAGAAVSQGEEPEEEW
ncbi:ATP-dependent RNA helicase vasa [Leguminivora glycinivorella]|uniref:ATP-dependent RNA helicase vasa n=1 Tax=Leguminivora glycinivorella TaxID=1035111 RepID=UPI00200E5A91|nr:ATP-dependent RNA helicase vasa [Leguminivora glycinivorella]